MGLFGSDNYSGVHPEVLEEIARVNSGHVPAYGYDPYTAEAIEIMRSHLGEDCDVEFVFNGTGSNVLALSALLRSYEGVLAPSVAHIYNDECGAMEHISGNKIVPIPSVDGKITPADIEPYLPFINFMHSVPPKVISISNATELGVVYSPDEIRAIADLAHSHGLLVHCDGARIANAAVSLGVGIGELAGEAGIDVLSHGGTKNGMMGAEAVVLFGEARTEWIFRLRKSVGQLSSKMRFISAQYSAMYRGDLWARCAAQANHIASYLNDELTARGFAPDFPVDANEIFVRVPAAALAPLNEQFKAIVMDRNTGLIRLVASWDSTIEHADALLATLDEAIAQGGEPNGLAVDRQ